MKRIKMLLACLLALLFVCAGCGRTAPAANQSITTDGKPVRYLQNDIHFDTKEQTVSEGELFRVQFEGDAVAGTAGVVDGKYRVTATKTDGEAWHIKLESNYPTVPGNDYRITYTFISDVAGHVKFGDVQEFPIQAGENEVTGVVTAKDGTTYLDLQLGMLKPFTIDFEKISVAEFADEATFISILPSAVPFESEQAVYEQHDDGFEQTLERAADGVTANVANAPANGDVWNSKLFIRTGAVPEPGKHYLISADIAAEKEMDFEICLNNGDEEKGYGALYGQRLTETPATFVQTVSIPKTGFDAGEVVLQLMLGKSAAGNRITVKNVKVEEIKDAYRDLLPADFAMDGSVYLGTADRRVPGGYTEIPLDGFSFTGTDTSSEGHDDGYVIEMNESADGVDMKIVKAPENAGDRGVWKAKLFVDTGVEPEAGKTYRISFDLTPTGDQAEYEACFDGSSENAFGALYGRSLTAGTTDHVVHTFSPSESKGRLKIRLQLGKTDSGDGNTYAFRNLKLEELTTESVDILPGGISYRTGTNVYEQHADGYTQHAEASGSSVSLVVDDAPGSGEVWQSKLFMNTGFTLEAGNRYQISVDVVSQKAMTFELDYNRGGTEKGYGALYGQALNAGSKQTFVYAATADQAGILVLQFDLGASPAANTITASNVQIRKLSSDSYTELPLSITYYSRSGNVTESHDAGYTALLESAGGKASYRILKAPDAREVWNARLFINTGFTPEAGKKYRIGLDLNAARAQSAYEICYNGGAEKDYGGEYGLSLASGANHADHIVTVDESKGALTICLQLGKTNGTDGNTVTVGNLTIYELTPASDFHNILTGFGYPYVTVENVEHNVEVPAGYQNIAIGSNTWENHDEGYEQTLSGNTLSVTAVPEDRGVWKSKLFVDTQKSLEAGAQYRVSAKVSASAAMGFEICLNNGGAEKGYEALYGQSVAENGTVTCVKEFTVPADATDLNNLVLQFQFGNTTAPNTITVSGIKLEKWTEAHTDTVTETVETLHKASFNLWAHESYTAALSGSGNAKATITEAPGGREVWKVKLFANTNTVLTAGKTYRITANVSTDSGASYEVCYNDGGVEKGVKQDGEGCAEYGQTGSKTIERTIVPDETATLNIQFSIGNLGTGESFTVSGVKVEELGEYEAETEVLSTTPSFSSSSSFSCWAADGYSAGINGNSSTATLNVGAVPSGQEVWKLKLFASTGVHLTAGTPYRIYLKVNPSAPFSYEVCYNNGGEEKGVHGGGADGAQYGLSGTQDLVYEVVPDTDADLVIQISAGNAPSGSTVSVSGIRIEAKQEAPGENLFSGSFSAWAPVNFWAHEGYEASLSNTGSSASIAITSVPDSGREAWKVKLFAETGAALSAGKNYRISMDVQATASLAYEICYNNGASEKALGAEYGLTASSVKKTVVHTVTPESDATLTIQCNLGNAGGANTVTVSNVKVEEITEGAAVNVLPDDLSFDSEGYINHAADSGYVTEMTQNADSVVYRIVSAPAERNPWNVKLFVKTGFTPEKNKGYRVSFDINSEKKQNVFEVFCDGKSEAGYGQITGQSLPAGKKTVTYQIKPGAAKGELTIQLRLGKTDGTDGNSYTVSNLKIEEIKYKTESVDLKKQTVTASVQDGYQTSIGKTVENATMRISTTPQNAEAWKVKLFVNTGAYFKAGNKYRIRFDVSADTETGYEVCFNHGDEEKGLGALYGLSAGPKAQVVTYTVYAMHDIDLVLQLSLGNCAAPNALTIGNVHVEEAGTLIPVSETVYTFR